MNPTAKHIWNTITRLEREQGIPYSEMAKLMQLSDFDYANLRERGEAPPLLSLLLISEKFDLPLTDFSVPHDETPEAERHS